MSDSQTLLDQRKGLPDALRLLTKQYPREIWRQHPNFDGLTSFWLDRHQELRDGLEQMRDTAIGAIDRSTEPDMAARHLIRAGKFYVDALEIHHQIEDFQYFPIFTKQEPRLSIGFSMLDADHDRLHQEMDGLEEEIARLIRVLQDGGDSRERVGRFHARLAEMAPLLNRHLIDEEELVVPIILEHGSPHV